MSPRVLVVYDGGDGLRGVRAALEARGLAVDAAEGQAALASLDAQHPDVILLEVGATPINGMVVLDRIRANPQHSAIPVVLLATGADDDDDLLEGYKFGADYYLTQPFSPRHLIYALSLVLGREFPE
jgi:two-component system, OmpR family, response regulator